VRGDRSPGIRGAVQADRCARRAAALNRSNPGREGLRGGARCCPRPQTLPGFEIVSRGLRMGAVRHNEATSPRRALYPVPIGATAPARLVRALLCRAESARSVGCCTRHGQPRAGHPRLHPLSRRARPLGRGRLRLYPIPTSATAEPRLVRALPCPVERDRWVDAGPGLAAEPQVLLNGIGYWT
jgi:hypothetical protein